MKLNKMTSNIKNRVVGAFKMHGYTLRLDASKYLVEMLLPVNEVQREDALDRLLEAIQKQPLKTSMIDRSVCELAVRECNQEEEEDSDEVFSVIDAFEVPRFTYVNERKKFIPNTNLGIATPSLFSDSNTKAELFRERYALLHQRTSRHDLFTPPALGSQTGDLNKKFQLKPIEYLLGSTAKLGDIISLGMLTQLKEGKWFLEDPTGAVQLDLSRAMSYFGNINFFGGNSSVSCKASAKLKQIQEENEDAMLVILSDVWLDNAKVLEKLKILFSGYSDMPPVCFVFCGNFTSQPYGSKHVRTLKESLKDLSDLLSGFPDLSRSSRFLFVPGPQDPGYANILPRPPIPQSVTEEFRRRVPGAIFCTNPCRIQYCSRQIVVFREDIVMKMCRNCVRYPSDGDIPNHFAKTVICQAHLCPLPLHIEPVYWSYDNALRVYPLPDLIVCADKYDPFNSTQVDCTITNPGSFPRSDFSFKVYYPASGQVEESRIADE